MNISDFSKSLLDKLTPVYGNDEAGAVSRIYLEERLKLPYLTLQGMTGAQIPATLEAQMLGEMDELVKGCPLQYVLGYQWFYGKTFQINKAVLIPRPETEELVSMIIEENKVTGLKVIDIGTGSGCIPVMLKLNLPGAEVFATDISPEALETASANAEHLHAEVTFIQDDILKTAMGDSIKFDIAVSNPPYITHAEAPSMAVNVTQFEPHLALFVPDSDPLLFYRAITSFMVSRLSDGGRLYFEINPFYGKAIAALLESAGFEDISIRNDLSGNNRFIRAVFKQRSADMF